MKMRILLGICVLIVSCSENFTPVDMQKVAHGLQIYETHCANCHQLDGKGLARIVPPLLNADYIVTNRNRLPAIVKYGMSEKIWVNGDHYQLKMPGNPQLTLDEITAIVNFVEFRYAKSTRLMPKDSVALLLNDTI
ncbi:MAG: cytochrome c [Bacteroidia bacterium]|nr:cytochrome c [Bacteroidia bacterium]